MSNISHNQPIPASTTVPYLIDRLFKAQAIYSRRNTIMPSEVSTQSVADNFFAETDWCQIVFGTNDPDEVMQILENTDDPVEGLDFLIDDIEEALAITRTLRNDIDDVLEQYSVNIDRGKFIVAAEWYSHSKSDSARQELRETAEKLLEYEDHPEGDVKIASEDDRATVRILLEEEETGSPLDRSYRRAANLVLAKLGPKPA